MILKEVCTGKIAIHGSGWIGRSAPKAAFKAGLWVPASISEIQDIPALAALFAEDTNYGCWHEEVKAAANGFVIGGREIPYFDTMQTLLNWGALVVDVVVDCTGRATQRAVAQAHLDRGARRVLVSAPSKSL